LASPELGAKQICPTCSTKFYDLGRRPATCPKCNAQFDPEEALRSRRVRARAIVPEEEAEEVKPPVAPEVEDGFEAEPEEAPELDAVVDDPPIIPGEEDDAEDADAAPAPPDEALGVDFAEEEDDIEEAEDDEVPFVEDEDDDFPADEIGGLPPKGEGDDR
jgi:uncharacterized protein (TIGR02300 family)